MTTATQTNTSEATTNNAMSLQIYNTLSRTKEPFEPVTPGKVGMYLCGPTVYKPSHIGHMVGPVLFDVIKRYLVYCGYDTTFVINVTDVDDKLINESNERGMTMSELALEMEADYMRNLEAMGVDSVDHFPRATDNIDEIIALTSELIDKQCAYASDGDVFFDVAKDADYGKLTNRSVDNLQGEGGEAASKKRSPADFALWKAAKEGEPAWDSPWGRGRPGWHIECSAMCRKILGKTFDIHAGGLDLTFPHHENEIAQSECCHDAPMAKYWMHNGLMQAADQVGKVGGRNTTDVGDAEAQAATKISKSTGASAFSEMLERHPPESIRYFLISTHYRSPISYSEDLIRELATGLESFYRYFARYQRVTGENFYEVDAPKLRTDGAVESGDSALLQDALEHRARFLAAMDDDFNTAGAIAELFEMVRSLNKFVDTEKLEEPGIDNAAAATALKAATVTLRELGLVLGLFRTPPAKPGGADDELLGKVLDLAIELRQAARANKDFATGDAIRDGLAAAGVVLEDRPGGTEWSGGGDGALDDVMKLMVQIRADARGRKDFDTADQVRNQLSQIGVVLDDRPGGTEWRVEKG
ncbi:MAG: cysteine--tRNA ligase [Pirellulales bacterium]|nr:cysteine--tRNA ligase [Pirellulales bacterium]